MEKQNLVLVEEREHTACLRCNICRPPQCHHCSQCDACVLKMDHHCPFVFNCIGLLNQKHFILLTVWGSLMQAVGFALWVYRFCVCYPSWFPNWRSRNISQQHPIPVDLVHDDASRAPAVFRGFNLLQSRRLQQHQLLESGGVVLPDVCSFQSDFAKSRRDDVVWVLRGGLNWIGLRQDFLGSDLEGVTTGLFHYSGMAFALAILFSCLLLFGYQMRSIIADITPIDRLQGKKHSSSNRS